MCWGRPAARPVSAANAISGPPWATDAGHAGRTGARSASPVAYMFPDDAMTPRSDARHVALGPSRPNGVTSTQTARGAALRSTSGTPGSNGVHKTTSADASNDGRSSSSAVVLPSPQAAARRWSMYLGPTTVTAAPSSANRRPATCTGSLPISTTTVPSRRPGWEVTLSYPSSVPTTDTNDTISPG